MKKNLPYKVKWANLFVAILLICSFKTVVFSFYSILMWQKDNDNTAIQIANTQEATLVTEVEDSENTEIIETQDSIETDASDPYWDYIKMNLIDVDLTELKKINSSVKGWLQVNGTNINYPFVQTDDNLYYLTHSFDGSYNAAGWLFMDYRNNIENMDKNTIIYAHGRTDRTMFGSLKNILSNGWLNDKGNHVIKLSTEKENTLWQVFSVYHIPTTSDYIQVHFYNDQEFLQFASMLIKRSAYDFGTTVSETDKILTLSTCYSNTDKVVLHAKLIKKETK